MGACLAIAGKQVLLAGAAFTLAWTHSVEKTGWQERWTVTPDGLVLREARVRGSGAGMDPGEGARLEGEWWVWNPDGPLVPKLVLAASGATGDGWRFCHDGHCRTIGRQAGAPVEIAPCVTK